MPRDEIYIIGLCDGVLGCRSLKQHRFPFLRGDTNRRLPVDAFYQELMLVIEYREQQHTEEVPFFNRRLTISGVSRGTQRALYDQRRREELPRHGIQLVELNVLEFPHTGRKRLLRIREQDIDVIRTRLKPFIRINTIT
ncbi:MAG TPA: hypothetical protein VK138_03225 [Acidiferrobacterales bacterium]|nr:hypothetical protein [Acidiferrobacterales bacterium]